MTSERPIIATLHWRWDSVFRHENGKFHTGGLIPYVWLKEGNTQKPVSDWDKHMYLVLIV